MTVNVIEMIKDCIMKAGRELTGKDDRRIGRRSATSAGYSRRNGNRYGQDYH